MLIWGQARLYALSYILCMILSLPFSTPEFSRQAKQNNRILIWNSYRLYEVNQCYGVSGSQLVCRRVIFLQ